ncbi:hypothetical protein VNO78_11238 [Psophocarpus tetragonolobus]|uniref:Kinesin motor domain-containing protein n=1 Tax=Psophocarpus tetragonolobus TaxID=3891 RepID=A0AAN9ST92_PSOTE
MLSRNPIFRCRDTPSSSAFKKPRPTRKQKPKDKENLPPPLKTPFPPKPPNPNPLKRKLSDHSVSPTSDSGVKVIVRMRPPCGDKDEEDSIVQSISNDSLSINGQNFTFDSVANTNATQLDIFELVGVPLVENCLAGVNSSVFAYGQTGSGKTYTMWGPANALSDDDSTNDQQGLAPRVFERLFARINEEQIKHSDKQLKYQCHCSFLEIYNEHITDLLDPNQRNLQVREAVKSGVYVENLTEEQVCTKKDVTQLLIKGLLNRRIGATSINSESSRSHTVFTCVVESQCKSIADGLSIFRTSKINLVDLAGSERQKLTGAAGDRLKEAGNINRSLSQLGNLINILAEISQTGKPRHIPYRDSRLTFLMQESLGGNAKLAFVCAISPAQSCKSETFSTLRFAQRVKAIKNKAIVNEVMHDDVNQLRDVIRQLRDELHRIKANDYSSSDGSGGHSAALIRRSLNLLKPSLNCQSSLPRVDEDGDEEMEIDEEGVEDHDVVLDKSNGDFAGFPAPNGSSGSPCATMNCNTPASSVVQCKTSPILKSSSSLSPTINSSRKSLRTSLKQSPSENIIRGESDLGTKTFNQNCLSAALSSQAAPNFLTKSENLAASIRQGLEIIDNHHRGSSLLNLSLRLKDSRLIFPVSKVDVGVQTSLDDNAKTEDYAMLTCNNCKRRMQLDVNEIDNGSNVPLVPIDCPESIDKLKKQILKAVEKVLAGSIRREMALEEFCAKQTSEIMQLNCLLQKYRQEKECDATITQIREDKILRLQSLVDGVLSAKEFVDEELMSLALENKLLKENQEHHSEVLKMKIELKRVQDELEEYKNFYQFGEREVLMEEICHLRNQLHFYVDSSSTAVANLNPQLQLTYSSEPSLAANITAIPDSTEASPEANANPESTEDSAKVKFEQKKSQWTEAENRWISLTEKLRAELEASRSLAEKRKQELDTEKKRAEELNKTMQMAIEGHARILEQYAELEEKHIQLLERHRMIQDGIDDVKKAASIAGVRGAESEFINALAVEISALKAEKEKEREILRDENRGLQAQLKDTAEAVQAAGELLVRLKEAEEGVITAQKRAMDAEQEAAKAYKQIDKLKKKHEREITTLNKLLAKTHLPNEEILPTYDDTKVPHNVNGQFELFCNEEDSEFAKLAEQSWLSGYDTCNI